MYVLFLSLILSLFSFLLQDFFSSLDSHLIPPRGLGGLLFQFEAVGPCCTAQGYLGRIGLVGKAVLPSAIPYATERLKEVLAIEHL